jgi:hypothetical protein
MKAKNRFWRMLRIVACDSLRALTMPVRSPLSRVTPALSIATSVPVPMAMPTSAAASAGASLTPSPAIATTRPSALCRLHDRALLIGQHLGLDLVDAELAGDGLRRGPLSPVSMTTRMPSPSAPCSASGVVGLDRIGDGDQPAELPSTPT